MIKLYYAPRTRSTRPRWLLEELGVPYELVRLDLGKGDHKKAEYLAIHPHGVVPALEDDGRVIIESLAICLYVADKFPEKGFAPEIRTIERDFRIVATRDEPAKNGHESSPPHTADGSASSGKYF